VRAWWAKQRGHTGPERFAMRVMFTVYLTLICAGLAYFLTIGLLGR
jgi:hypothetical protein